jgi:hypothetical protein
MTRNNTRKTRSEAFYARGSEVGDGEPACRRDSVRRRSAGVTIHLRGLPEGALAGGRAAHALCMALLRVGVAEPPGSPRTLVRSCRTVSPLPVARRPIGGLSLLPYRQVAPTWLSPAPLPYGVPTFLDTIRANPSVPRPPGRLTVAP